MRFTRFTLFVALVLGGPGCSCETGLGSLDGGLDTGGADAPIAPDAGDDGGGIDAGRCVAATVTSFALDNYDDVSVRYRARIQPELDGQAFDLYVEMNRYGDTEYVGTFPLGGTGPDGNFGSCAHCVAAFYGTTIAHGYFADAGTLELRADPFTLELDMVLEGARLIEVTIGGPTLMSTPVPGGDCITLSRIEVDVTFPPPGWTCPLERMGDGETCDCRCGAFDPDCFEDLPIAGCMGSQLCLPRLAGGIPVGACVDDCDRDEGVMCPAGGVCVDDWADDICTPDIDLVDRSADIGEVCRPDARWCAVTAASPGPGVSEGYCDLERGDRICRPRCHADTDCDAAAAEVCVPVGATSDGMGGEEPFGYCAPRFGVGWTCEPDAWEDGTTCDCACGARDPDCYLPDNPVTGCLDGELCVSDGTCASPPGNDTCATALPLATGVTTGTLTAAGRDYVVGGDGSECTAPMLDGPDVVYSIALAAGQTLVVQGESDDEGADIALYLLGPGTPSVCDATGGECVVGAEAAAAGEVETLRHTAVTAGTYYVIVDTFLGGLVADFELTTTLD